MHPFGGKINETFHFFCMTILRRKILLKILMLNLSNKTHVSNLTHFQNKMTLLFFFENKAPDRESVNSC